MRIAVLSDIHGNRTAFKAVLGDLKRTSPDLILHGGDLADAGANASEIVDQIRDLGWHGVVGNTDEMLFRPESLTPVGIGGAARNLGQGNRRQLLPVGGTTLGSPARGPPMLKQLAV